MQVFFFITTPALHWAKNIFWWIKSCFACFAVALMKRDLRCQCCFEMSHPCWLSLCWPCHSLCEKVLLLCLFYEAPREQGVFQWLLHNNSPIISPNHGSMRGGGIRSLGDGRAAPLSCALHLWLVVRFPPAQPLDAEGGGTRRDLAQMAAIMFNGSSVTASWSFHWWLT